jgi:hypothetical protein
MTSAAHKKPGPRRKRPVRAHEVCGAKYLRTLRKHLKPLHSDRACANRRLHLDEYAGYVLMHFFNPLLGSMRALQQVSTLRRVQERFSLPRFSLGSFSEAGRRFHPQELEPIISELVGKVGDLGQHRQLSSLEKTLTAVDSTLMRGTAAMLWALWRTDDERAFKVHLEYEILKGVPGRATLTDGKTADAKNLRDNLSANRLYVLDRGYVDYGLLAAILDLESSVVVRLQSNAVTEVLEVRPLSDEARKAGVTRDIIVRLGCADSPELHNRRLRLVEVHVPNLDALLGRRPRRCPVDRKTKAFRAQRTETVLLLATDLLDLPAELIALIYRCRWQIELFFRWFKIILKADHLLSQSQNGLTIVVYCALIASLLIVLWTGRKPTKRTYEMLCHYFAGWVEDDEWEAYLGRLRKTVA